MKRFAIRLSLLLVAGLIGGCLQFKEQTMSYRYDKASDALRIFQDYRGIFGGDADGDAAEALSGEELEQLESVLKGGQTFFFANWIFEYKRENLEEYRANLKDPAKRAESGLAVAEIPKLDKLFTLLIENVRVANGPFYIWADRKLCGVQLVTFSKFTEIIAAINDCTPALLKALGDEEDTTPADLEAIAKFGKDADATLFQLDGNAMTLRWPMSRASYDTTFGDKIEDPTRVRELRAAGIGIAWKDEVVTFTLGKKDDEITELTLSFSKSAYTPNAIAPARAQHIVKERFDAEAAAKTFLLGDGSVK